MSQSAGRSEPGFFVAAVNPFSGEVAIEWRFVGPADPLCPFVIGSHERADISVLSDVSLPPRLVLLLLGRSENGRPRLRALDLRSGSKISDIHGVVHHSIAADGPLRLRARALALFVIPSDLQGRRGSIASESFAWPEIAPFVPDISPEQFLEGAANALPSASALGMQKASAEQKKKSHPKRPRVGRIRLEAHRKSSELDVDMPALRSGVLVGRNACCDLNCMAFAAPSALSGVHALFIAVDERIHVFDLSSTHGMTYEGFSIRSFALPRHRPAQFSIAEDTRITWWPT